MVTIHVLACGEMFELVLNALAAFLKQDSFEGLLRIAALVGIIMVMTGFLKTRDPKVFGYWFLTYVLCTNVIILPKTTVEIEDISAQKIKLVDNVPVVFALSAHLITTVGYGLAQVYDMLLSIPIGNRQPIPEGLLYTRTGSLFGSRLIQAATSFRILDPVLKEEMNDYFRVCVVGDIRINRKYSVGDLSESKEIWNLISAKASPLRMLQVGDKLVTCKEASSADGTYSLRKKLEQEINRSYKTFGVSLFGKPQNTTYQNLFETHLKSSFEYYQGLTDTASNIFLQSMMINAMRDGIGHYQAFTDATAGVVNQQLSKSQVQHRWSWQVLGQKALWILPIMHTCLTMLLFGVFPLILVLTTLPFGVRILSGYFQFFLSLQFWPVMFAILNVGMAIYGASSSGEFGQFSMVNLDKIDELHGDVSGVCGYIMMMIPFIAMGFVSNFSGAFNNLATSMMSHMQGSSMSAAGEAANASFGIGQTSFYNTTANNFSANKHDSNWSHLHGMHTEQMGSGVLKTVTGSGGTVFDVSPGMSRSAVSINSSEGLSASLNDAYEQSTQAARNQSSHYQTALSNASHRALQLSQLSGHDLRLGDGVSNSESGQFSKALSTMNHIAEDVASRTGMSKEDAYSRLISNGVGGHAGVRTDSSLAGKILKFGTGFSAGVDAHVKAEGSSSESSRYHSGTDTSISARQAQDFNQALNYVNHFAQTHHFDESHSTAASLSSQLGADLREAQTASHNYDASMANSQRISQAKSYVETHGSQITTDLNQAFPKFVEQHVGKSQRDELFTHPGDLNSLNQLNNLGQDFIAQRRDALISEFGGSQHKDEVHAYYGHEKNRMEGKEHELASNYHTQSQGVEQSSKSMDLGIDTQKTQELQQQVGHNVLKKQVQTEQGSQNMKAQHEVMAHETQSTVMKGKEDARRNTLNPKNWIKQNQLHPKE